MECAPDGKAPIPSIPGALPAHVAPSNETARARYPDSIWAAALAVGYIGLHSLITGVHPTDPRLFYFAALLSLVVGFGFAVTLARALRSRRLLGAWLAITAAAVLPVLIIPLIPLQTPAHIRAAVHIYRAYTMPYAFVPGLRGVLLIAFAACVGASIARLVREIKLLLPAAIVLALIDLYVVFGGGLVQQANSGHAPRAAAAMRMLSVSLAPTPPARGQIAVPPSVGFADFLFAALFFACFARFGVPARRTFTVLCSILCMYMAAVIIYGLDLPALVPIAVVVVACNHRVFRYRRDELFALLYAGLIVAAVLGLLVFLSRR